LQERYPSQTVFTITNGFDPEHFAFVRRPLTAKFTITYAGLLYQGRRDPGLLFEVLRELFDEKIMSPNDVQVRFYGRSEPWVTTLLRQYRLEEVVAVHGVVTRDEAVHRQAESQILLMLGWADPRETGQHSGKLFEYLGAARPILAIGGSRSVLTDTLNETGAGTHAFSKAEVRTFLIDAYGEFKGKGFVSYHGREAVIGNYTHYRMAGRFAKVLNLVSQTSVPAERPASPPVLHDPTDAFAPVAPKMQ
jgi:glycosyltransferase involved in cell wall biosynthesis